MSENAPCFCFYRNPELPGVELFEAQTITRWCWYLTHFAWIVPDGWFGEVLCHETRHQLAPGGILCADPQALCCASRVNRAGRLSVLFVERELIERHLDVAALPNEPGAAALRCTAALNAERDANPLERFAAFCQALRAGRPAAALRASLMALMALIVDSTAPIQRARRASPRATSFAERLRALLDADPKREHSIETLSLQLGQTRFQALRAFKQRYGLAPSAYQMCRRIAGAQLALRAGAAPAAVALDFGFTDQSHLNRQFKRIVGVSPGDYARAGTARAQGLDGGSAGRFKICSSK
jgi:AraC-like DNA-binding protein